MLKRLTLQEQAYDYLKNAILDGSLAKDVNHSETSFAELLGISRTPVREAIFKLRQEGFLESIPGCGFRVKKLSTEDIQDFYEMRSAVEAYCAYLIAEKQKSGEKIKIIEEMKHLLSIQKIFIENNTEQNKFTIDDYVESDDKFHELIVQASGNRQFIEIIGNMRGRIKFLAKRSLLFEDRLLEAYKEHAEIAEYIEKGKPEQAYESIISHFKRAGSINSKILPG